MAHFRSRLHHWWHVQGESGEGKAPITLTTGQLINDTMVFAGPMLLNLIIRFIGTPAWPVWYGICFGEDLSLLC
jgi:hypothetical protein